MEVIQSYQNQHVELKVIGELDASSAIKMDDVITQAIEKEYVKIMVNCEDLQYISSAGLGVFVSHLDDLKTKGGGFYLYNLKDTVTDVFTTLGLDKLLTIRTEYTEALSDINA